MDATRLMNERGSISGCIQQESGLIVNIRAPVI
jgi:hypothetical protein